MPKADFGLNLVAQASRPHIAIHRDPAEGAPLATIRNPQPSGSPVVFLLLEQQAEWLKVLLPLRPNGSTGWVRRSETLLSTHDFRVVIELADHCITVFKGAGIFLRESIGVGTKNTPTPGGVYYTKELFQPPDSKSVYGPYAYGLSGFSNVLTDIQGAEPVIGIHGNNDSSSLGRDVSAGCIRMSNAGITHLARTLPLGVPVEIRP